MNSVLFNIESGSPPFIAELIGDEYFKKIFNSVGEKQIDNVPIGVYTLKITDSNDCVYEQQVYVDQSITTTTTTKIPDNAIVVGNINDPLLIFNEEATNINTIFTGYPDPDIVTLYLWFKTYSGEKINNELSLNYIISSADDLNGSKFVFNNLSDEIHAEVIENTFGPSTTINGTLLLKPDFIETYFQFIYLKSSSSDNFYINIEPTIPTSDFIYTGVPTKDDAGTNYGVHDPVLSNRIILSYDLLP